ncbi:PREDICTED: probable receptor-like protein kinase At1g49730 isoform X1 [Camelina sativa]|uniref:Probable receptor-like protein kinase At1g49730 isoform X1 n=1 Tax=Camelina sativa TaxID=90675 RepID=A0ABM0VVT8_CAMSA|nr:PREDICTED: probable receptor-like protein kinase At1g49730 isoform X1 [Camelina sativa]
MVMNSQAFLLALIALLATQLPSSLIMAKADCPLDFSSSNFTLVASVCSNITNRGKCCRYMNAFVAVSVARYANLSSNLGVASDLSETCIASISRTMEQYGVSRNATSFCGLGTKILVKYDCEGRTTVRQMHQSPEFGHVSRNCRLPLSSGNQCRKCLNSGITYLRDLIGPDTNNITLSTCRDATYATLASRIGNASTLELLGCFFQVTELSIPSGSFPPLASPEPSPSTVGAISPSNSDAQMTTSRSTNPYHLTMVPTIGIVVTAVALTMLVVLVILIRKKNRELDESESLDKKSTKSIPSSLPVFKIHEDDSSSAFRKFSYKEMTNATNDFNTVIGQGGFGTVYKAELRDGLVAAVKRMNKVSEQAEQDFCREIELLAKLHHRNLVALKGFCINKKERFLVYDYMENGSLKDHLHATGKPPLSWGTRMKIAIDVANALEYLHFYCDPPLCHRDIKSSNILLDENFVAKLSDFGLAHSSRDGSICFEPVNTNIRGTPGYVDPEYVVTQELTEKSDVYSYGVVLLELITGRRAVDEGVNLVEMSQRFLLTKSKHRELVDPRINDSIDDAGVKQLEAVVAVVRWCTEKEGRSRPSIKQVLRLLCESCDPLHSAFAKAVEGEIGWDSRKRSNLRFQRGDSRIFGPSSSTTSRSHYSQSLPHSPINGFSF